MAELDQVLGAILQNITQARFASDVYSRDVSRYYEQDALLRRFPVPRAEIDEIDVDLRFVITGANAGAVGANHEASTAQAFSRASFGLAARVFDVLIAAFAAETELVAALRRTSPRISLQQDILVELERNQGHLVRDGKLDLKRTGDTVLAVVDAFLPVYFGQIEAAAKVADAQSAVRRDDPLLPLLQDLAGNVERALAAGGAIELDVGVTTAALSDARAETISSIRLKARVRNYTWSQVDEKNGRAWRSLNPD
jgi:hypothetical protein